MNAIFGLGAVILWLGSAAAWITAIVHCIANEKVAMLLIDGFIPPVGVIHGIVLWLT